jgi:hypothetical protein
MRWLRTMPRANQRMEDGEEEKEGRGVCVREKEKGEVAGTTTTGRKKIANLGADWLPCCVIPDAARAGRLAGQPVAASGTTCQCDAKPISGRYGPHCRTCAKRNINTNTTHNHNTTNNTQQIRRTSKYSVTSSSPPSETRLPQASGTP